jgi:hypothetical protein
VSSGRHSISRTGTASQASIPIPRPRRRRRRPAMCPPGRLITEQSCKTHQKAARFAYAMLHGKPKAQYETHQTRRCRPSNRCDADQTETKDLRSSPHQIACAHARCTNAGASATPIVPAATERVRHAGGRCDSLWTHHNCTRRTHAHVGPTVRTLATGAQAKPRRETHGQRRKPTGRWGADRIGRFRQRAPGL